jgi:hypothetical protein
MALLFSHRSALSVSAVIFVLVAFAVPATVSPAFIAPTTLFLVALSGIAAILVARSGAIPWLRRPRLAMVAVIPSHKLDAARRRTTDDALDAARMDDDGG